MRALHKATDLQHGLVLVFPDEDAIQRIAPMGYLESLTQIDVEESEWGEVTNEKLDRLYNNIPSRGYVHIEVAGFSIISCVCRGLSHLLDFQKNHTGLKYAYHFIGNHLQRWSASLKRRIYLTDEFERIHNNVRHQESIEQGLPHVTEINDLSISYLIIEALELRYSPKLFMNGIPFTLRAQQTDPPNYAFDTRKEIGQPLAFYFWTSEEAFYNALHLPPFISLIENTSIPEQSRQTTAVLKRAL